MHQSRPSLRLKSDMFQRFRDVFAMENNENNNNNEQVHSDTNENDSDEIRLKTSDYKIDKNGSVVLSLTLDKDQIECCVCLGSMTNGIFKCPNTGPIHHNICVDCEWQIRYTVYCLLYQHACAVS